MYSAFKFGIGGSSKAYSIITKRCILTVLGHLRSSASFRVKCPRPLTTMIRALSKKNLSEKEGARFVPSNHSDMQCSEAHKVQQHTASGTGQEDLWDSDRSEDHSLLIRQWDRRRQA